MKRICSICARAGSKGVGNKNLRILHGRPLVARTVEQALASGLFDDIAISSDSPEIRDIACAAGATIEIARPAELASDTADKASATLHCVTEAERRTGKHYDTIVDLDVTAPLRRIKDIAGAVMLCEAGGCTNVFTACPSRRSPYFSLVETDPAGFAALSKNHTPVIVRRQDGPATFDMNGAAFVWPRATFFARRADEIMEQTKIFVMPEWSAFDIDSELDWQLVEFLYPRHVGL